MPQYPTALLEQIKQLVPISRLVGEYVVADKAKSRPGDTYALCPYHPEKSPSFHGEDARGHVHCFGCGANDDHFGFVSHMTGLPFPDAVQIVADLAGVQLPGERTSAKNAHVAPRAKYEAPVMADPYEGYEFIPVPAHTPPIVPGQKTPPLRNPKRVGTDKFTTHYKPSAVYAYFNAAGQLLGYVLLVPFKDGKSTPGIWWVRGPDGFEGWCHGSLENAPLYGLPELLTNPDKQVLVVEGEKCRREADKALQGRVVVVSWCGGVDRAKHADWSPLNGRSVIWWPDDDDGGHAAMFSGWIKPITGKPRWLDGVIHRVKARTHKVVKPYRKPDIEVEGEMVSDKGGDVADLIAAGGSVADYIKANISEWKGTEDAKHDNAEAEHSSGRSGTDSAATTRGSAKSHDRLDQDAVGPKDAKPTRQSAIHESDSKAQRGALNDAPDHSPPSQPRPQPSAAPENNSPGTQSLGGVSREAVAEENADDLIQVPEGEDWRDYGVRTEEGKLKTTSIQNVQLCLQYDEKFKNTFAYNDFSKKIYVMRPPIWERMQSRGNWVIREVTEVDMTACQGQVEYECLSPKIGDIQRSIARVAEFNHFNPVKDRLRSLVWDGRPRLSGGKFGNENYSAWLTRYLGAANSEINAQFGRKWMISAVARALRPGCKVDTMIILEGPQGLLKSTALRILAEAVGDGLFTDNMTEPGSKDAVLQMQGKLIIEIAELEAFRRADVSTLKAFLSTQEDEVRRPYARMVETFKRSCVFAGTENPSDTGYLKDATGARRFWPVLCGELDIEYLKMDAVQLWAEAVVAFDAGEQWWLDRDSEDLARVEQAKRYKHDPWAAVMDDFLQGETQTTPLKIMKRLDLSGRDMNALANDRIVAHLKMMGWERKDINGSVKYVRPT